MNRLKSVYDLEGSLEGDLLFVVAPGPSAKPIEENSSLLDGRKILALNSAIEFLPNLTWWLYADKRFSSIYQKELHTGWPPAVLMRDVEARKYKRLYQGELFTFCYQLGFRELKKQRRGATIPEGKPFWWWPEKSFIAGRCSVFSHAMSMALIMRPRAIVLIGVDFKLDGESYYVDSVSRNEGPTRKDKALKAGSKWFASAYRNGVWPGLPPIVTTSKVLASSLPGVPIQVKSLEEVLHGQS